MKFLLSFGLAMAAQYALANNGPGLPQAVCPAMTETATEIMSSIQSLRDEVNKSLPECAPIDGKLKSIGELLGNENWSKAKKMFRGEPDIELNVEELDEVSGLIEGASKSLAETVSMLSGGGANCVIQEHKTNFLGKLSGVVREVSSIAGHVTGPYGMAVSMGGQFLSSALAGIVGILPSNVYNFKDSESEMLFMNQFCSYTEIYKDTQDYLGLGTRQEELDSLGEYLKEKIRIIEENCPECEGYAVAWREKQETDKIVKRILQDVNIIEYGNDRDVQNYGRCTEIHRAFHTPNSDFDQFIGRLKAYKNPMMDENSSDNGLIKEVVSVSEDLKTYYPSFGQCTRLDSESKVSVSRDFNNFMRDEIVPLNNKIFGQQMGAMQFVANKKYCDTIGDFIASSLSREKWIKKERERVHNDLSDPNYIVSSKTVKSDQASLWALFVEKHLPRYLKYLGKMNVNQIKKVKKMVRNHSRRNSNAGEVDSRVKAGQEYRLQGQVRLALDQTKVINRYCEYVRYLLLATTKIETTCAKQKSWIESAYDKLVKVNPSLKGSIDSQQLWTRASEQYQTSRVVEYKHKIINWNQRGDGRWMLKSDQACPKN